MQLLSLLLCILTARTAMAEEFVVTATGDTNFIQTLLTHSKDQFQPDRGMKYGEWYTWEQMTKYLTPDIVDGDLNFTNIETVVTDDIYSIQLRKGPSYAFASHSNGVRHMADIGFNLFSLANNHAYDFGSGGLVETRESFDAIAQEFSGVQFAGLEFDDEYGHPLVFEKNGLSIAFAAVNGVGGALPPSATSSRPSVMTIRNVDDYQRLIKNFSRLDVDLKILSIHNGAERQTDIEPEQAKMFRYAVDNGGVNLILGHHPHVVRPVEIYNGAAIFYSLGNFLMLGAANIDKKDMERNYGAMGKVYFDFADGELDITAVKVIPFRQVHYMPRPFGPEGASRRIQTLNTVTRRNLPQTGLEFSLDNEGRGIFCLDPRQGTKAWDVCDSSRIRPL